MVHVDNAADPWFDWNLLERAEADWQGMMENQVSHEKRAPGWLFDIGDLILLPSCMGTIINHYQDPGSLLKKQYFMESKAVIFSWLRSEIIEISQI